MFARTRVRRILGDNRAMGRKDVSGQPLVRARIYPVEAAAQYGYCPSRCRQRAPVGGGIDPVGKTADYHQAA